MVDCLAKRQYNQHLTTTGTVMKTNKEKNTAHDAKMQERVRPKQKDFEWAELEKIVHQWRTAANESSRV
jgi:hypothetical protein